MGHLTEFKAVPVFLASMFAMISQAYHHELRVHLRVRQGYETYLLLGCIAVGAPMIIDAIAMAVYIHVKAYNSGQPFKHGFGSGQYIAYTMSLKWDYRYKYFAHFLCPCALLATLAVWALGERSDECLNIFVNAFLMVWSLDKISAPQFPWQSWLEPGCGIEQWQFKRG